MAVAETPTAFERKVHLIFERFDLHKAGSLNQACMAHFVRTVNPGVPFTDLQMDAITEEVFEQYDRYVGPSGLSEEGLRQIYADGNGNVDIDFLTLGLSLDTPISVAAASTEPPAAAVASSPLPTDASSKEDEDAFFKLALSAPTYESHRASPAKPPAYDNTKGMPEPELLEPSEPDSQINALTPAEDSPAAAIPSSKAENLALWASMDVVTSPTARLGSPAQRSDTMLKGPYTSLAVDTSAAALEPGVPSPAPGVSPKQQGSRIRASTPTRGSRVATLAQRFSEPSPLAARPPSPHRFRESQLAARSSPVMGARPANRSIDVRASTGSLRASIQDADPPPPLTPLPRSPGGSLVGRLVKTLESSPVAASSPPARPATPSRRSIDPAEVAHTSSHKFEHLKDAQWVNARRSRARTGLSFDGPAVQPRQSEGAWDESSHSGDIAARSANTGVPGEASSSDRLGETPDVTLMEAEEAEQMQNNSLEMPVQNAPGRPGVAMEPVWEEEASEASADDLFVERENSFGQKVLEKSPSAISITARVPRTDEQITLPANFVPVIPEARAVQHTRTMSEAQELLEAANMPPLKVTVPIRGASFAAEEPSEDNTPASTSVAEQEAEVGRESLDSFEIAAHKPGTPSDVLTTSEEKQEKVKEDIRMALAGGPPSPQRYTKLRSRVNALSSNDAAFQAHMEMGQLLAQQQQYEEAVSSFEAAIARLNTEPRAYFRLGNALFSMELLSEAEHAFRKALEVAQMPADKSLVAKVHTNLGITLEAQGLLLGACQQYREASALNSAHYRSLKLLGGALFAIGDLEAAREALQAALALNASYPDAYCDLGCTLCALGEADAARLAFENAIRLDKNHITSLFNIGNLERQYGRYEAALGYYNAVLAVQPQHWRSLLNSAVALIGLRRSNEAQDALKRAIRMSGQGDAIAEEVRLLKKLAKRGGDPAHVNRIVSAISEKTAARTLAPSPKCPTPRRLWRVPSFTGKAKPGSSALAKLGISPEQVPQILDLPLLHNLAPLTQVASSQLLAQTYRSGSESPQAGKLTLTEAEAVIHQLLPATLPPKAFQALMHCVAVRVLPALYDQSPDASSPGCADRAMLLSILIALSNESLESRAAAILAVLASAGPDSGATRGHVEDFIHAAKAVFGGHAGFAQQNRQRPNPLLDQRVSRPKELMAILLDRDEGFPIISLLPTIADGEAL